MYTKTFILDAINCCPALITWIEKKTLSEIKLNTKSLNLFYFSELQMFTV